MLLINEIAVPKWMVGHGVKGVHVALIDLYKRCQAVNLPRISPITKLEGEWEFNEGVTLKVAHRRAVTVDGGAERWVPTRRLLWMYPLSFLPTDVDGAILLTSTVDLFMGLVPVKGLLEARSYVVKVKFPKSVGRICHICRNQRPDCEVKTGPAGTKCPLFGCSGTNRCNRCFNTFQGNIQNHFVEHCLKEKQYLSAGYVQPTALVATSTSDSVIDDTAETKLARMMAQQIMAAPIVKEKAASARTQTTTSSGEDIRNFKARFAKRDAKRERARGGFTTPAKPPTQRQKTINPIASPTHSI